MSTPSYAGLPRTDGVPLPSRLALHGLRPLARVVVQWRFAVRVHDAHHVPATGPVILAANHIGVADGPVLAIFAPRPVHALTKEEMFEGRMGGFLRWAGQIRLDRFHTDPAAVKTCLRTLEAGRVVGIFPEGRRGTGDLTRFHRGAGYLALASGAPVVPVSLIGTREPGGHTDSLPRRGGAVDMVFGTPYPVARLPWPRTREQVEHTSTLLREHMRESLAHALALTGRSLPGPLPADEVEPDPATGVA